MPGSLGGVALPGAPIKVAEGEIGRRRIFPRASRIVPAERAFDESESADDAVGEKLFGFGADDGADALRTDLHDASGFLRGGAHGGSVGSRVGHGLLAVDGFSSADGVTDDLPAALVGDGGGGA